MPRKNLARRFEPRYGVNQAMLEMEAQYVGRELEDYCLLSFNDLREKLAERHRLIATAERELEQRLSRLDDFPPSEPDQPRQPPQLHLPDQSDLECFERCRAYRETDRHAIEVWEFESGSVSHESEPS